ncbi:MULTISPECIES: hypothetical protein [Amycolatopsis]|uniref:Uncharacterized protein n=1 Tax=Amycolatopsis bullii TaxID=941987 RepID=A0ABQ3K1M0_9PSEU|nr:hypothetical protein [Amycolatopsis bullii]GHF99598.1 hypothetical protein GCM10017567_13220 [Amycolatopsis bullii]
MHTLGRSAVALALATALAGCANTSPPPPTSSAPPAASTSPTLDLAQQALCGRLQVFSTLLLHFSADLARTVLPDDGGGRERPGAAELARQADVIAGAGAELAKTAPTAVKADVDTVLEATAEAKAHLAPGGTPGSAVEPMYRQDTEAARTALGQYGPCPHSN